MKSRKRAFFQAHKSLSQLEILGSASRGKTQRTLAYHGVHGYLSNQLRQPPHHRFSNKKSGSSHSH